MMKMSFILIAAMFVVGCTNKQSQIPPATITHNKPTQMSTPYDVLANATIFGFGVKDGQMPTARNTDGAFEALLCKANARSLFTKLFSQNNIHAKLYALFALYHLDKEGFYKLAAKTDRNEAVRIRNGCVLSDSTVGGIIGEIENGEYDYIIKDIKKKNAEPKNALDQK